MDITIYPQQLSGTVHAIPSKSYAHRALICAAFSDKPVTLLCPQTNQDIEATASCLCAIGAEILRSEDGYTVYPVQNPIDSAVLDCGESGSTLRFLLPIVGALGLTATFKLSGRLPFRPLSPLWEEMERMGCKLSRPTQDTILCTGKLLPGNYTITGNVSSQFITGLMLALKLIKGPTSLTVLPPIESKPYITLTESVIGLFNSGYTPSVISVEGDWSNGAFFLAAKSLGNDLSIMGLDLNSKQGDKAVVNIMSALNSFCEISAADIPDLVPILAVYAAANKGARFTHINRLRTKESDRVTSVISMLKSMGAEAQDEGDSIIVYGGGLIGGRVDCCNDHRIAMAAAIAATVCLQPVHLIGAQCVEKSYPAFWQEYARLGGKYEQYIR